MGISKKALLGAAGLCITVVLIFIGFSVLDRAKDTSDMLMEQQDSVNYQLENHTVMKYDGYSVTGSIAITYIKTCVGEKNVPVKVITNKETFTVTDDTVFPGFRDISSVYYINPLAEYRVKVIIDANEAIESVVVEYVP